MSISREEVIQFIENMTVLELSEFVKELEDKFGVQAAMPMMAAAPGSAAAAPAAEAAEEKTEFNVTLTGYEADKKIQVIKAVRTFRSDLGLKEAKELVDSAPVKVLEGVPKDQAESAANALKEQDAVVEIS